jgi:hypothetical protein
LYNIDLSFMEQKQNNTKPVDVTKKDRLAGVKAFLKKRPKKKEFLTFLAIAGGILLAGSAAAFTLIENPVEEPEEPVVVSTYVAPPPEYYSPLTGVLTDEASSQRPVTGVMVENSIDARPQSGLQEAGIVYEAIAEGGITRFLALYQEAKPGNIGPIRSARPYYVRWAAGYDARYLHSGGSGEALALIQTLGIKDMDHGKYSDRVASRVSSRYAPHNVYTSMDRIDALGNELGYTKSEYTPFARKKVVDEKEVVVDPTAAPAAPVAYTAAKINFDISGANYNTSYTYDPATNTYARVMAGRPHTDQDSGKQITPTVVIALQMAYGINPNRIHSIYENVGSGEALIFQDGMVTKATWIKSSDKASLELKDANGKAVELNAGQTWITAIPPGRTTYSP